MNIPTVLTYAPVQETSRGAADRRQGQLHAHLGVVGLGFMPQAAELEEFAAPRREALDGLHMGADNDEPLDKPLLRPLRRWLRSPWISHC